MKQLSMEIEKIQQNKVYIEVKKSTGIKRNEKPIEIVQRRGYNLLDITKNQVMYYNCKR
ncbi:hypothetical protein [Filifactor alocis]|uniref:hypothetical protein n=1 Tax=Filifactor alocis TaxID=143361 RepID=UPI003FA17991